MKLRDIPLRDVLVLLSPGSLWKSRKNNTEWYGACPVHKAKKNNTSFSFSLDGRFHCFSCGSKGRGAIDLVMAIKNTSFKDACSFLESISLSVPNEQDNGREIQNQSKTSCSPQIEENSVFVGSYEKFKVESEWLKNRGIPADILEKYGVFEYNNPNRKSIYSNRVMIPMKNWNGELVGYLARATQVHQEPKYLLPKGVAKHLEVFGAYELRQTLLSVQGAKLKTAFLVESPFAVMRFASLGFPAVSPYGWSVSEEQAQILSVLSKGWIYLPDADKAVEGIQQATPILSRLCWVKCPEFPCDDPELLTAEQIRSLT